MSFEAWLTVSVTVGVFALLATDRYPSDGVVLSGLVLVTAAGVLPVESAFAGFANPAIIALAGLYILTAALRLTGALDAPARALLRGAVDEATARRRLTLVTTPLSAFLNNTPVVALMMPVAASWARRHGRTPYGLLLPLSYAAVLGGTCTLMGTSTHLVVHGLMLDHGMRGFDLFELTPVGLAIILVGLPLVWLLARRLLSQDDPSAPDAAETRREYTTDLRVREDAPFLGNTVEEAELRHLEGLFLVRITRGTRAIAPVAPDVRLVAGDVLTFAGVLDTIVDLQRRRGLEPTSADDTEPGWVLHESVISRGSPLVGRSIKEANFRGAYNAAVVAVHRHGEQVHAKVGDIVLRHGDTLLLMAADGFARTYRDSTQFYLVSEVEQTARPRHHRAWLAVTVLLGVVIVAASGAMPLATAAIAGAVLVVVGGCLSPGAARRAVDSSVLVVVGSALGLARAVEDTGVAAQLADGVLALSHGVGPMGSLVAIYLTAMVLTEMVTNTAAAALTFPVAMAVAHAQGLDPRPFAVATSVAASISLATPLGYQTNMMVYGPGGYRFLDFVRMGAPLQLVCAVVALTVIPLLYGY